MSNQPSISIVIPARNAEKTLAHTLESITAQSESPDEIIILDDGSHEPVESLERVRSTAGIRVIRLDRSRGPAVARNAGAAIVRSDIILFIDADVLLHKDVVAGVRRAFRDAPGLAAVQGIYSNRLPDGHGLCTRYQNHYYHFSFTSVPAGQTAICATFCFAVSRDVFEAMGGFDTRITRPTVEDEAFGYRLAARGYEMRLDHGICVTHLATYTLDQLILRKLRMSFHQVKSSLRGVRPPIRKGDRNRTHHSIGTLAAVVLAPFLPVTWAWTWPAGLLMLIAYTAANARFWAYLSSEEPPVFFTEMLVLTWIDHMAIACGLAAGTLDFILGRRY